MEDIEVLGIIPARGGSKGIPRKNARYVAGKPLLGWAIDTLLETTVDRVSVSTDDPELEEIAIRYGAEVIPRPTEISGDEASSESALIHGLDHLRETEGYIPDTLVFVQCTSLLLTVADVEGAIETFLENEADVVFSVTPFHGFLWEPEQDGHLSGINHDPSERKRRQDREVQYKETGGVYVMDREGFEGAEHRFFGDIKPYVVPPERSLEVDRPVDLKIAHQLLRDRAERNRVDKLPDCIEALVLDFDGVFTDNKVHVHQDRTETVVCHRGDGWGIAGLKEEGLPIWVLSTEKNPVVKSRCDKLDLPCVHGAEDKKSLLTDWLADQEIAPEHLVFLGNDVNDKECLQLAGAGVVVADAHPDVKSYADLVLSTNGGQGAVRELTDLIQKRYSNSNQNP